MTASSDSMFCDLVDAEHREQQPDQVDSTEVRS
jgi:hypothetical protein